MDGLPAAVRANINVTIDIRANDRMTRIVLDVVWNQE